MHAKGSGAFGKFTVTNDISQYTKAAVFNGVGKETDLFMRFSTVAGERGAADAERDIRGFAVRMYTEEGNLDIVDRKSTRLNSSHVAISYAVFCLKKKKK